MSRTNEAARAVKDDLGILLLLLLSTELMMYDLSGSSASLVGWLGVLVGCWCCVAFVLRSDRKKKECS